MFLARRIAFPFALLALVIVTLSTSGIAQRKRALTFQDIMKFNQIESPVISEDGAWVAYAVQPDRGDGEGRVQSTHTSTSYAIPRGGKPVISPDSRWVAMVLKPKALDIELKPKEKQKSGLVLLATSTGDTVQVPSVESFAFSNDSRWLAYLLAKEKSPDAVKDSAAKPAVKVKKEVVGSAIVLRRLDSGSEVRIPFAMTYAFDSTSRFFAYVVADTTGSANGLYVRDLARGGTLEDTIAVGANNTYTHLSWSNANRRLAFVSALLDEKEKPRPAFLWVWDGGAGKATRLLSSDELSQGWMIPSKNDLIWTKDGQRLFFGLKPTEKANKDSVVTDGKDTTDAVLFDVDGIVKKRELDVWHWNDPRINANQKKRWKDEKDRTFRAVYNLATGKYVPLADEEMPAVDATENPTVALGRSNVPYLRESTWRGEALDIYLVDLATGSRKPIVPKLDGAAYLSPAGKWVVYYRDKQWYLYSTTVDSTRSLTESIGVPFHDEEDDTPSPPPAHGFAGWTDGDKDVLLYDKYDIWQFPTDGGAAMNITGGEGRRREITFRVQRLDPDARFFKAGEELLLTAYHNKKKYTAFYAARIGGSRESKRIEEEKRFVAIGKAKRSDVLLFTRQSYTEFPDLWVSDLMFKSPRKITNVNPQMNDFAWGTAELVEWKSLDGKPLEGVLIKPRNYSRGTRYTVLVY